MFLPTSTPRVRWLRISVIGLEAGIWCDMCGAFAATTVTYTVEEPDGHPRGLHQLTYCDTCELRDVP